MLDKIINVLERFMWICVGLDIGAAIWGDIENAKHVAFFGFSVCGFYMFLIVCDVIVQCFKQQA